LSALANDRTVFDYRHGSLSGRAGYVLEPVRSWPDRTMRRKSAKRCPAASAAASLMKSERSLVREPAATTPTMDTART